MRGLHVGAKKLPRWKPSSPSFLLSIQIAPREPDASSAPSFLSSPLLFRFIVIDVQQLESPYYKLSSGSKQNDMGWFIKGMCAVYSKWQRLFL
jgi:hypothetical protein